MPPSLQSPYAPRGRPAGRWWVLLVVLGWGALPLGAEVSKEYQIKAAFLFNFTKFVEWPQASFADEASPLVIGVLGDNPFGDELGKVVRDRKVHGRDIVVVTVTSAEVPRPVHLLFVDAKGEERFGSLSGRLREAGVLTVGETEHFIARGGIIVFTLEGNKVRFEINQKAAEQARLKLSAQLLKLATVVHQQSPG